MQAESFPLSIASGNYINGAKIAWKVISLLYICEREQHGMKFWMCWKKNCKIRSVGEGCAVYISEIISWHFTIAYVLNFAVYAHKCSHRLCTNDSLLFTSIYVEVDLSLTSWYYHLLLFHHFWHKHNDELL